jgi:TetR/AcrR family transcriptional regulator, regulator of biofilm formation and stress response
MATATRARKQETPRPRGAARREALLEAVLRIVADVGADAVTHRRVAEEAGLPLASTTYWFDSKEHLLTEALEWAAERDTARLLADVAARQTGNDTPQQLIDAAVATIVDSCSAGQPASRRSLMATYTMLLEAARRPALQGIAERWTEIYLLTLGRLLERAGSKRPYEDAKSLLGAADGLLLGQLATGEASDLRPALTRLATALVNTP